MARGVDYGWSSVGAVLAWLLVNLALAWVVPRRPVSLTLVLAISGITMAGVMAIVLLNRGRAPGAPDIALAIGLWLVYMALVLMRYRSFARQRQSGER